MIVILAILMLVIWMHWVKTKHMKLMKKVAVDSNNILGIAKVCGKSIPIMGNTAIITKLGYSIC